MRTDQALNQVIDDVALAFTAEPTPDLRARVLSRLSERRRSIGWPVVALSATGTALVVLVAVIQTHQPPKDATGLPPTQATGVSSSSAALQVRQAVAAPKPTLVPPRLELPGENASEEWESRAVQRLPAIDAVRVSTIQPANVVIPLIVVKAIEPPSPLVIQPIAGIDRSW